MAIPQVHHVNQFSRNVEHLLQQSAMKLTPYTEKGSYTGKSGAVVDQIGSMGVIRDRARHTDTPHIDVPGDRRWIFPHTLTTATMMDKVDLVRMLIDPQSKYTEAVATALGRAADDEVGAAFYSAAMTGENGTVSTSFSSGQDVGVNVGGVNSGLNVAKLRAAKRLFMAAGVDLARVRLKMAITAIEHDNLLGETQVTSLDYNDRPTLVDGRVTSFMGFDFVHVEWQSTMTDGTTANYPLSIAAGIAASLSATTRNIPAWIESGIHYGTWDGLQIKVDQRSDKNYNTQIWGEMICGATRTQEKKVVRVACLST